MKMRKIDSGKDVNYIDRTDSSTCATLVNSSADPEALFTIIRDQIIIYDKFVELPADTTHSQEKSKR